MLDRYGNEIVISEKILNIINGIKVLPEDKLKEGLSVLSYIFPGNIIYFGYLNKCYDLEDMKNLYSFFCGSYRYFHFKEYDDYIKMMNNILDKLGLTEEVYNKYKDYIKKLKSNMLDKDAERRIINNKRVECSFETRSNFAYLEYYFDDFTPYKISEEINEKNYYFTTLNFEYNGYNDTPYQILDYYAYKKYADKYENADNENLLIFEKLYTEILKDYKYSIETTEENQVFIFLEDTKKEETDYLEYVSDDEEDKIIFFSNNTIVMLELASKLSNYFMDNEMKFRSVLNE